MSSGSHVHAAELLRRTETADFRRDLAPGLELTERPLGAPRARPVKEGTERDALRDEGLLVLPAVAEAEEAARIAEAVGKLVAEGLPGTFVYAYDATEHVAPRGKDG